MLDANDVAAAETTVLASFENLIKIGLKSVTWEEVLLHFSSDVKKRKRAFEFALALQSLDVGIVETGTNMVFFTPNDNKTNELRSYMEKQGVKIGDQSPSIRMVLHRDITDQGMELAINGFKNFYQNG